MTTEVTYKEKVYTVTDEQPKTNDKVLTDNYGVWTFHEGGTAPMPYWANPNACKKIIAIDGVDINEIENEEI
jgi:hypothetical protein